MYKRSPRGLGLRLECQQLIQENATSTKLPKIKW